jgi:hypothetical protein
VEAGSPSVVQVPGDAQLATPPAPFSQQRKELNITLAERQQIFPVQTNSTLAYFPFTYLNFRLNNLDKTGG